MAPIGPEARSALFLSAIAVADAFRRIPRMNKLKMIVAARLARLEGLEAHARAADIRGG